MKNACYARIPMYITSYYSYIFLALLVILFGAPVLLRWLRSGDSEVEGDDIEGRVSMTVQDAKGQTFHIKVIPPATVLDADYTRKLDRYLKRLAQMCSQEGLTFTKAAMFSLPTGMTITPEFQALLAKHGLSSESNIMYGP